VIKKGEFESADDRFGVINGEWICKCGFFSRYLCPFVMILFSNESLIMIHYRLQVAASFRYSIFSHKHHHQRHNCQKSFAHTKKGKPNDKHGTETFSHIPLAFNKTYANLIKTSQQKATSVQKDPKFSRTKKSSVNNFTHSSYTIAPNLSLSHSNSMLPQQKTA
jgi:hypothetical protein